MRLVYIAGPYTADNGWLVKENIHAAEKMAARLVEDGRAMPVTPHSIGANFYNTGTPHYWYSGTLELMRRCDAVLALPTWAASRGATEEVKEADRNGQPVFYDLPELFAWLSGKVTGTVHGQRGTLSELLSGLPQTMLLRCGDRTQEIRHWRDEADDGVVYEVSTINGVKISPILHGAFPRAASIDVPMFEQVEGQAETPWAAHYGAMAGKRDPGGASARTQPAQGGIVSAPVLTILDTNDDKEAVLPIHDEHSFSTNPPMPGISDLMAVAEQEIQSAIMSATELSTVLREMASCVDGDDSYEGTITYEATQELRKFKVSGSYRHGNLDGQGSVALLGVSVAEHTLTPAVIDAAAPIAALDISTGPVALKAVESLKPSAATIDKIVGQLGCATSEAAAVCIILALAQRGDTWRPISLDEVAAVTLRPRLDELMAPRKNPDGSEYRFVEWHNFSEGLFRFTEAGIAAVLRRNCQHCEHFAKTSQGAGDCHQPRSGRFTVYASDSCPAFFRSTT